MTREIVIQKILALGLVALAVTALTPEQMLVCFIVFGQGHFLAAYYYQWRAGKISERGFSLYVAVALALFTAAYITQRIDIISFVTFFVFLLHHFQDEVLLFGKQRSLIRSFEQLGPVIMFTALTADALFMTSLAVAACIAVVALTCVYALFSWHKRYRPDALSAYLGLVTTGLMAIALFGATIDMLIIVGALILNHYICWYVHFYFRFKKDRAKLKRYFRDMIIINAIVVAGFSAFLLIPDTHVLLLWIFVPLYFYIWTILHIASSVRISDYRDSIRLH